ncbi:MAG: RDD family protein [Bacillales bacterium]|nr:RDD family protein [Bacillales bacterium]
MNDRVLREYQNDESAPLIRRIFAHLFDGLILIIISLLSIIIGTTILASSEKYMEKEQALHQEMIACYKIEEEAKIYEFVDNENNNYQTPREQSEIFEDYCLMHILYSYQVDPTPFNNYHIEIDNPKNLPVASYETDNLAYFYVYYAGEKDKDLIDFKGDTSQAYFYQMMKKTAVNISMWHFDEESYALPYLDGYFALDLYQYLFSEDGYEAGLTNYNYLAVNYQNLWNIQVQELIGSTRFQNHYQKYKTNYAYCAHAVAIVCICAYCLSFLCGYILPQIIFKHMQTFGKKIFKIYVVDKEGYETVTSQKIIRNIVMFFFSFGFMLISFFLGGGLNSGIMYPLFEIAGAGFSLFTFTAIAFILQIVSMIVMVAHRKKRAIQDFISDTICIDYRFHINNIDLDKLEIEEHKKDNERDRIVVQNEYFDSSSFNNTERKDLTDCD